MTTQNATLFISDLHLDASDPRVVNTFFYFLEHIALEADALYILGDFFERYVGDHDKSSFVQSISHALSRLTDSGLPVYLMHGNRDFLMGKNFAKRAGVTLIPDPSVISLYEQKIILMHGDSLCTHDKSHQRFRKIVRHKIIQKIFLSLSLSLRERIAAQLRNTSKRRNNNKTLEIMDVCDDTVTAVMKKYGAKKLIHGHTHRPLISENRMVLDAWHDHGNYLKITDHWKIDLINIEH